MKRVMTFSHDQIRDHLVDFLAGDLAGEARAAFEAHVAGCETCRGQVRGFEQTRRLAREVVRAPLAEAVPSRVRARVLEAAAAAARQPHVKTTVTASAQAAASARKPGWLARWFDRKTVRWTFPTFATVAAMAAFLLVRETVFREAKRPLSEVPEARVAPPAASDPTGLSGVPSPSAVPSDSAETDPKTNSPEARAPMEAASQNGKHHRSWDRSRALRASSGGAPPAAARPMTIDDLSVGAIDRKRAPEREEATGRGAGLAKVDGADKFAGGGKPAASRAVASRSAPSPKKAAEKDAGKAADSAAARVPVKGSRDILDDLDNLDSSIEGSTGSSGRRDRAADKDEGPASGAPKKRSALSFDEGAELDRVPVAPRPSVHAGAPSSSDLSPSRRPADERAFAVPPPAPRPAPTVTSSRAPGKAILDDGVSSAAPPPAAARAAVPSAEPPAPREAKKAKAQAAPSIAPSAPASASKTPSAAPSSERASAAQAPASDPVPLLVDRAEKLMVARRFSEAAAAYRELLRRFPGHVSVPAWRKRLATADAAAAGDGTGFASPPPSR